MDSRYEYLKWFDYWLKDLDTGVMDDPPVTLFIRKYKETGADLSRRKRLLAQREHMAARPGEQYTDVLPAGVGAGDGGTPRRPATPTTVTSTIRP